MCPGRRQADVGVGGSLPYDPYMKTPRAVVEKAGKLCWSRLSTAHSTVSSVLASLQSRAPWPFPFCGSPSSRPPNTKRSMLGAARKQVTNLAAALKKVLYSACPITRKAKIYTTGQKSGS